MSNQAEIIDTSTKEAFDAARIGCIGSSDIVTVAGLNPYKTPLRLWLEMKEKVEREPENDAMWLGKELESTVAKLWAKKTEHGGYTKNNITFKKGWSIATPDYLYKNPAHGEGILECKTTGAFMKSQWEDNIPDLAHCQVQWQMGIAGYTEAQVACLIGGRDFVCHKVEFANPVFEQLYQLGERFMEYLKTDTPPEARAGDLDDIKDMFHPKGTTIALPSETETMIVNYLDLQILAKKQRAELNGTDTLAKTIEAQLRMQLADASEGTLGNYRVILKPWSRKGHEVKASSGYSLKVLTKEEENVTE